MCRAGERRGVRRLAKRHDRGERSRACAPRLLSLGARGSTQARAAAELGAAPAGAPAQSTVVARVRRRARAPHRASLLHFGGHQPTRPAEAAALSASRASRRAPPGGAAGARGRCEGALCGQCQRGAQAGAIPQVPWRRRGAGGCARRARAWGGSSARAAHSSPSLTACAELASESAATAAAAPPPTTIKAASVSAAALTPVAVPPAVAAAPPVVAAPPAAPPCIAPAPFSPTTPSRPSSAAGSGIARSSLSTRRGAWQVKGHGRAVAVERRTGEAARAPNSREGRAQNAPRS